MIDTGPIKMDPPYKRVDTKIIIDQRTFSPCKAKEVEEWSWKKLKYEKWIVHLKPDGKINKYRVSKDNQPERETPAS